MTEFNLSEKRKELWEEFLAEDSELMWEEIIKRIEEQDKEFIRLLREFAIVLPKYYRVKLNSEIDRLTGKLSTEGK